MRSRAIPRWLVILFTVPACLSSEPFDDPSTSSVTSEARCDPWGCGTNSATVGDGIVFDELDAAGTPNRNGVRIVSAKAADGRAVSLRVKRHELYAVALDGSHVYQGVELANLILRMDHPDLRFELQISKVQMNTIAFWRGLPEPVPAYEIRARLPHETKFAHLICKNDILAEDPRWTAMPHSALVFEGDRYDPVRKRVSGSDFATTWFNLACAGTAPAKLHLQRYTLAGSYTADGRLLYPTSLDERQAMLKMFTADYCGKGYSFTRDGQPLLYTDAAHTIPMDYGRIASMEALWTRDGATCLDVPRLVPREEVLETCGFVPPSCGSPTGWEYTRGILFTANPR